MAAKKMTSKTTTKAPTPEKASKTLNEELDKHPKPEPEEPPTDIMSTDSFLSPESSNIHGAQYFEADPEQGLEQAYIRIHFKDDSRGADRTKVARIYEYTTPLEVGTKPIDITLWEQFKAEASKGRYFASQIRNKYKCELIWPVGK